MLLHHLGDGQNVLLGQHRAGGVTGRIQQQRLGVGRDALLDIRRHHTVVVVLIGGHRLGARAGQGCLAVVVGEAGVGHQDLIAGIQQ